MKKLIAILIVLTATLTSTLTSAQAVSVLNQNEEQFNLFAQENFLDWAAFLSFPNFYDVDGAKDILAAGLFDGTLEPLTDGSAKLTPSYLTSREARFVTITTVKIKTDGTVSVYVDDSKSDRNVFLEASLGGTITRGETIWIIPDSDNAFDGSTFTGNFRITDGVKPTEIFATTATSTNGSFEAIRIDEWNGDELTIVFDGGNSIKGNLGSSRPYGMSILGTSSAVVPEPNSAILAIMGGVGILGLRRRRN